MTQEYVVLIGTGPGERLHVFGPFTDPREAERFAVTHIDYAYHHHATRPRHSVVSLHAPG